MRTLGSLVKFIVSSIVSTSILIVIVLSITIGLLSTS